MNQPEKSSLTEELKSKNIPIKYLAFTFLLANTELPFRAPYPSTLSKVPSLPSSPASPTSNPPNPAAPGSSCSTEQGPAPRQDFSSGRTPPSGIILTAARLPFMLPAPSLGSSRRSASPSPVSCCVPDPGFAPQQRPHTHTGKKIKIIEDIQPVPSL